MTGTCNPVGMHCDVDLNGDFDTSVFFETPQIGTATPSTDQIGHPSLISGSVDPVTDFNSNQGKPLDLDETNNGPIFRLSKDLRE